MQAVDQYSLFVREGYRAPGTRGDSMTPLAVHAKRAHCGTTLYSCTAVPLSSYYCTICGTTAAAPDSSPLLYYCCTAALRDLC
jgi:hypothetical protein